MKMLVVINPVSGDSDNESLVTVLENLAREQGVDLDIYLTTGNNDTARIEEQLKQKKYDRIAAFGGDGTINMVALLAREHKLPLGIIPGGSSNGLAKDLQIPSDPEKAFGLVLRSEKKLGLDMILVNNKHHILHMGDVGANTNLLERMDQSKDSTINDLADFAKEFVEDNRFKYNIRTSQTELKGKASMITFCNARKYGTGVPLTLRTTPSDGQFELVIFNEIRVSTLVNSALAAINDSFLSEDDREVLKVSTATIEFQFPQKWQMDGEVMPPSKDLKLEVLPNQVRVICGDDCPYIGP